MFITTPPNSVVRAEYGSFISSRRIKANLGGNNRIIVFIRPRTASENMSHPEEATVIC